MSDFATLLRRSTTKRLPTAAPERFLKNPQVPNFIKIRPVGAELFLADGQTDTTKLTDAFPQFCDRALNMSSYLTQTTVFGRYINQPVNPLKPNDL
jgi:hypothetical protein